MCLCVRLSSDRVRRFIGDDDLALRIFCPLVQVAFETNRPVQAFAILLGAFKYNLHKGSLKELVSQAEPCRWIELFDHYLDMKKWDKPELGNLLSRNFFRLDRFNTSNMRLGGQLGHPVLGQLMKLWGELERDDIAFRYAFTAPNGYARQIASIEKLFHAPITLIKFTLEDKNIIVVAGDLTQSGLSVFPDVSESDVKGAFIDFLTMFSVIRRFGNALFDPDFRLCHHRECPLYENNYCNLWIFVPEDYTRCTFTERVEFIRKHFTRDAGKSRIKFMLNGGGV